MRSTRIAVVCRNPDCIYFERVREVAMTHLGQGVYVRPNVVCECSPIVDIPYAMRQPDGAIVDELTIFPQLMEPCS